MARRYEDVLIVDERATGTIYHARGDGKYDRELRRFTWWTRCGFSVGWRSLWIRRAHADLFARPCRRCYPATRNPKVANGE